MFSHLISPLYSRNTNEAHRVATQLELFFDLVIVIAFAAIAKELHHDILEGHFIKGGIHFFMAFLLVWWPWNAFTWFASSFDNDDAMYRFTVMLMMFGSMMIAASLPEFFNDNQLNYTFFGYALMRFSYVIMWIRVGKDNINLKPMARRFIIGQLIAQSYWGTLVFFINPSINLLYLLFATGFILELYIHWYAEKAHKGITWHRHHIIERFGLLNIIVLGEILLAATLAFKEIFILGQFKFTLFSDATCGVLIAFSMWWLYFADEKYIKNHGLNEHDTFRWGYGHVIIFASGVATGAGLDVMNTLSLNSSPQHINFNMGLWSLSIPMGTYILGLTFVRGFSSLNSHRDLIMLISAILILCSPLLSHAVYLPTIILIICVLMRKQQNPKKQ